LPDRDEAQLVETAEGGQIGLGERGRAVTDGSVRHVEVFPDGERENFHPRETSTSTPGPPRQHPLHPHLG
jgi:hypothetical protein